MQTNFNKCIRDDTKAAARQSLNCIKNKKIKYGEKRFSIRRMEFLQPAMWQDHDIDFARWLHPAMWHVALELWQWIHQVAAPCNVICGSRMTHHWIRLVAAPCNVTRSSGIMTLNTPCGSTLQRGRWLWDDMPLNSTKHPPYWNYTSGFDFDHIIAVDMSFYTSLRNFIQTRPPSAEKMTSCRFTRWRISAILDFRGPIMGCLKTSGTTSYRWSIDTIALNCLVFEKITFFLHFGDRRTNKQTNRRTAPTH